MVTHVRVASAEALVWAELSRIPDPEIPAISLVDLGVIGSVNVGDGHVRIELLPTFVGCPAIGVMQGQITARLRALNVVNEVEVKVSFDPPWTSDRISVAGRERLRLAGFAPPRSAETSGLIGLEELGVMPIGECPFCGSRDTTLENAFGPTLCRAIYHCTSCRQPFEQFKQV